ncbi:MAG: molecular chaperone [Cenarchaeum symbiont of Oopsacas minuta]|nr:molecular chaperone [Cenarchaeum symbiont of Oopsacas minuta]
MDDKEAYRILQLEYGAESSKVKSAYRKMALKLHPDRSGNSTEFKKVAKAYEILKSVHVKPAKVRVPTSHKNQWGAAQSKDPPEQDWSKYTKEFEDNDEFWAEYERKFWAEYKKFTSKTDSKGKFHNRRETDELPNIAVKVESSLCIGCCSCEIIAPGVFSIDKEKQMNPKSTVHNRCGASLDKIMNAAETCPTKAISVDDLNADERLYPF